MLGEKRGWWLFEQVKEMMQAREKWHLNTISSSTSREKDTDVTLEVRKGEGAIVTPQSPVGHRGRRKEDQGLRLSRPATTLSNSAYYFYFIFCLRTGITCASRWILLMRWRYNLCLHRRRCRRRHANRRPQQRRRIPVSWIAHLSHGADVSARVDFIIISNYSASQPPNL